jgi:nucleotide-binding universal stress UspA family protein
MILISYDGSPDSKAAIETAGGLMGGEAATVLTVWEPFVDVIARTPAALGPTLVDYGKIDQAAKESAERTAREGKELAEKAGLKAEARVASAATTLSAAILAQANEVGSSAIVMGSRGLTGVKSMLLGSVSHAVLQRADRPVLVVPSPEVAKRRGSDLRAEER